MKDYLRRFSVDFTKEVEEIFSLAEENVDMRGFNRMSGVDFVEATVRIYREREEKNCDSEYLSSVIKGLSQEDYDSLVNDLEDLSNRIGEVGAYDGVDLSDNFIKIIRNFKKHVTNVEEITTGLVVSIILGEDSDSVDDLILTLNSYRIELDRLIKNLVSEASIKNLAKVIKSKIEESMEDDCDLRRKKGYDDLTDNEKKLADYLEGEGKNKSLNDKVRAVIEILGGENGKRKKKEKDNFKKAFEVAGANDKGISGVEVDPDSKTPTLDLCAINMNSKAVSNKGYDPVIGREKEIDEVIRILGCRINNSPMLLGDPGCGKTAIVENLAELIAKNDPKIPAGLKGKQIYNLDINGVVAGCTFRGQFEERLQNIIKEVIKADNIILFIDEIHNMVGAGSSGNTTTGDMSNILKPFLSRGDIQVIGSTTVAEFRKVIEKDKALVRRFDPLFIGEPDIEDTVAIVKGLAKSKYESFHKVKYHNDALRACVEWSGRYLTDQFFPAKAIKIMDKAGANVKIEKPIDRSKINELQGKIDELTGERNDVIANKPDEWDRASEIDKQIKSLQEELKKAEADLEKKLVWPIVEVEDIAKVISSTTNIPLDRIKSSDLDKLRDMKSELEDKIIGQDEAIEELSISLQQNMLGLRDPNKPIASFLFVGPTGCGKTKISKTVAEKFFGSNKNLVTIACSEYMEDWAESKLLGSAPGYVGSETEPRLYILKRQPYSLILVDEIEKSSSNLYNIWLNMLEEGEVTLSNGEKLSCKNCIIIFTGNVGTKSLEIKGNGIGFSKLEGEEKKKADVSTVMKEVEKEFRPEFLNRLTKVVVFNSLEKEDLYKIFDLELKELHDRLLKDSKLNINVTSKLKDLVISKVEPKYGARSLKRLINDYIQREICKKILKDSVDIKGKKATVDLDQDENVVVTFK